MPALKPWQLCSTSVLTSLSNVGLTYHGSQLAARQSALSGCQPLRTAWPATPPKFFETSGTGTQQGLTIAAVEHLGCCTGLASLSIVRMCAAGVIPVAWTAALKQLTSLLVLFLHMPCIACGTTADAEPAGEAAAIEQGELADNTSSGSSSPCQGQCQVVLRTVAGLPNLKTLVLEGPHVDEAAAVDLVGVQCLSTLQAPAVAALQGGFSAAVL